MKKREKIHNYQKRKNNQSISILIMTEIEIPFDVYTEILFTKLENFDTLIKKYSVPPIIEQNEECCEVWNNLYIGTMYADYSQFDVVISVCQEVNEEKYIQEVNENIEKLKRNQGEYFNFPITESNIENDYPAHIETILNLIHDSILRGKRVLVHCYAGRNRSFCVVGEYLTKFIFFNVREYLCELCKNNWKINPSDYVITRMKTFRF